MVETGVSVEVSRPYCFCENQNHAFDNGLSGLKFSNAIADHLLDSWVIKKQAKESHSVWW